jgi:tetratricopeptide (TPR) repeat protein
VQHPFTVPPPHSDPLLRALAAVQEAEALRLAGKLDRAQSQCATVLRQYPDYVAALQTMGLILADRSQDQQALGYLHRASMLNPNDPLILTALAGVYLSMGANVMASRTLEQARQLAPHDVNILATLGEIYRADKEYELACAAYEAALKIEPAYTVAEVGLALSLMQTGQLDQAAAILQKQVREGSRSVATIYMLSQLSTSLVDLDLVALLDEVTASSGMSEGGEFLADRAFTRAAVFDRAGRLDEAWAHLQEARRYNHAENRKRYRDERQAHVPLLQLARTARLPRADESNSRYPISLFIVGPSRSGKTTMEQLVGVLPGVKKGYENPIVENAVRATFQVSGFPTRSSLVEMPPALGDRFRKTYFEEFGKRAGAAKVLTNTLPSRNEDAIRVAAEIPNARFLFIKRDLNDISLRIYMRHYKGGHAYASDLRDIRDYVTFCHDMIDVMASRMPDISRAIAYEDMIADPASAMAAAAALCNLEPHGGVLPPVGHDSGCATPYLDRIEAALKSAD